MAKKRPGDVAAGRSREAKCNKYDILKKLDELMRN